MLRIHADGSAERLEHGVSTLYPALHRGWTDDIYAPSLRAARLVQRATVGATGARDLGLVRRARPDRLQLGDVPCDPRRDRVHDEPDRAAPPAVERLPVAGRPRPHRRRRGLHSAELEPRRICSATCAPALVHRPPAVADLRRDGLGLVDRRLGRLELLAVLGDDARLGELRLQRLGVRLGNDRRRRAADSARYAAAPATTAPPSKRASRPCTRPMLQCRPAPASPRAASFPSGASRRRGRLRPKEARGNVIDYEILLLLDAELPDERQNEIVTRTRELVERGRRHLRAPRRLGPAQARLRDRPQGRGLLPPPHLLRPSLERWTRSRACSRSPTASCATWPSSGRSPARPPSGRRRAPTASRVREPAEYAEPGQPESTEGEE